MYNGWVEAGDINRERSSPGYVALPAKRCMADGECITNVIFTQAIECFRAVMIASRFIGKSFYIPDQGLVDALTLMVFNAYYIKCIVRKALFYQPVKFAVMLKFAIYSFKIPGIGSVRDGDRNFQGNGFSSVVVLGIEFPDHFPVMRILQPEKQSIISQHVEEEEYNEQYRKKLSHIGQVLRYLKSKIT